MISRIDIVGLRKHGKTDCSNERSVFFCLDLLVVFYNLEGERYGESECILTQSISYVGFRKKRRWDCRNSLYLRVD